ncbi:hypothetical protein ACCO45_007396 [Purpureocillium lilacinum]|uniref:Uncharacterized protein n=1 Tax=Purpureocillium lilacinum TaxID=33203 RepID=A0ACC4DUH5_PURLI
MRLINNATLTLESFMVTYEDFSEHDPQARTQKKGFRKIAMTCELAVRAGLTHSWVDTCCIDKRSSAELTEAINSMFRWYADAAVCFAWLADLAPDEAAEASLSGLSLSAHRLPRHRPQQQEVEAVTIPGLERCRWFTRGWTLQELIAPRTVQFYDRDWHLRGTKAELSAQLARVTNVSREVLANPARMHRLSVASRMAWASGRETTRVEDTAYCLLGIFDVNMPLLYGEGERAFLRLQEAIASQTNDFSLFAWTAQPAAAAEGSRKPQSYCGVFASSPADFHGAASIRLLRDAAFDPEFIITNKGLRMNTNIFPGEGGYFLGLNCTHHVDPSSQSQNYGTVEPGEELGIWIQQHGGGVYSRVRSHEYARQPPGSKAKLSRIFLSRFLEGSQDCALVLRRGFNEHLVTHSPEFPFAANQVLPAEQWDAQRRMFVTRGAQGGGFAAYAYFMARFDSEVFREEVVSSAESFVLAFGWRAGEDEPWVCVASMREPEVYQAMGDAGRMAAAIADAGGRGVRELVLRDYYQWITKVIRVSVEAVATEGMVVYNIDMELSPLYKKMQPKPSRRRR